MDPEGEVRQLSTYAKLPVVRGVTLVLPAGFCGPLHDPLAVQAETLLDDQESTALCPSMMVVGVTAIVTLGVAGGGGTMGKVVGVPNEQLQKEEACAHSTTRAAHQSSTREWELRFFDACTARAALSQPERSGNFGSDPCCCRPGRLHPSDYAFDLRSRQAAGK